MVGTRGWQMPGLQDPRDDTKNTSMHPGSSGSFEHRQCSLHYTIRGEGEPVVLIQGTGIHGEAWLPQVMDLESRYRCLYFDNRGIGRSQPMGAAVTVEQMAEDVEAIMEAQGWDSAHIVGHSLGGLIALCLALTKPARVRSLSLLCTFARGADVTRMTWHMMWQGLRTYVGTRRMRRLAFLEMVMPPHVLASADRDQLAVELAELFGHDLADQPSIVMKQLAAMSRYDATPHLARLVGTPALVVLAGHDRIARPELGRALAAGIPESNLVEFSEAAHGLCIQCPGEINNLLDKHFARAEQSQTSSGR